MINIVEKYKFIMVFFVLTPARDPRQGEEAKPGEGYAGEQPGERSRRTIQEGNAVGNAGEQSGEQSRKATQESNQESNQERIPERESKGVIW